MKYFPAVKSANAVFMSLKKKEILYLSTLSITKVA